MPRRLLAAVIAAATIMLLGATPALAGTANAGIPGAPRSNPLAGMPWGVYTGPQNNDVYPIWQRSLGRTKQLLAAIALQPTVSWFGAWQTDSSAAASAREYIQNTTHSNPNVLAQMAVFRLNPWEGGACPGSWGAANQASYRRWIDNFAQGIGSSRVALILQPDLPFAVCAPSTVPLQLVAYAARVFSALPYTTVFIDGGAHWFPMHTSQAVGMLEQAGIRYARGFALNSTEYDSTGAELEYGAGIIHALQAPGTAPSTWSSTPRRTAPRSSTVSTPATSATPGCAAAGMTVSARRSVSHRPPMSPTRAGVSPALTAASPFATPTRTCGSVVRGLTTAQRRLT
jgi:endoglucanase